jgi:hypothetical protein
MNKTDLGKITKKIMRKFYYRRNWFANLKSSQKAYFLGNIIFLLFFFLYIINSSLIHLPKSNIAIKALILAILTFVMLATISQIFSIKISKNNYFALTGLIKDFAHKCKAQVKDFKKTELIFIILVFITAVLLPIYILIEPFIKKPKLFLDICQYMTFLGIAICTITLVTESIFFIIKNYESNWFKELIKYMAGISSFISFTLAQISINTLTHVNPLNFPLGLTLYSIIFFPFIWFLLLYLILQILFIFVYLFSLLLIIISQVFSPFFPIILNIRNSWIYRFVFRKSNWNTIPLVENLKVLTNLLAGRLIGFISLISLIFFCMMNIQLLFPMIGKLAEQSHINLSQILIQGLVVTSYQSDSAECTNTHQGEWIKLIGDKKISVAMPDAVKGYQFKVRNCKFP